MRGTLSSIWLVAVVHVGCGDPAGGGGDPGTGGDGDGESDAGMPSVDGGGGPHNGFVDPNCVDGLYTETLPNITASLSGVPFSSGNVATFIDAVLMIRYPFGLDVVRGGRMNTMFGNDCSVFFSGSPQSAAAAYSHLGTVVHECGHYWDSLLSNATNSYAINHDLKISCTRGAATNAGGDTFYRALIRNDDYQQLRPPCGGAGQGCDSYANTYLSGQSGNQGFNMLLEETVQYINSLATAYAFGDQRNPTLATSDRDGILTFLWYVERYLKLAREDYPAAYARLSTDACWRDAILTVWGRAWLYLELTNDFKSIDGDAIKQAVADPALLDEIQRLRTLAGCQ
jgi:hypothetical protein